MKNKYLHLILSFIISPSLGSMTPLAEDSPHILVRHALNIDLPKTDTSAPNEAYEINMRAFEKVKEGNYYYALKMVMNGLQKFPCYFGFQSHLATLLGDYSSHFHPELKDQMIQKSKEIFNKLLNELEIQPKRRAYSFKNEYYFRFGLYKEQYELGLARVSENWNTADWQDVGMWGYYSQGVGAAHYAKELLIAGNKEQAMDYARKALLAWAQFFSYENSYYNTYVHYALALGILGYKDAMSKALERGREIIKKDHVEFQQVEKFFEDLGTK